MTKRGANKETLKYLTNLATKQQTAKMLRAMEKAKEISPAKTERDQERLEAAEAKRQRKGKKLAERTDA